MIIRSRDFLYPATNSAVPEQAKEHQEKNCDERKDRQICMQEGTELLTDVLVDHPQYRDIYPTCRPFHTGG